MRVRIWGCRGSIPVATNTSKVRSKLTAALRAADGRSFADEAEAAAFVENELPWEVSHSFGGNSSCVEIETGARSHIICDLGTGARELSLKKLETYGTERPQIYHVFMSHLHWDHIMGFPFFLPAYHPSTTIRIHCCHPNPAHAFRRQHGEPSFPVDWSELPATIQFVPMTPGQPLVVDGTTVTATKQYHGGDSFGYRFEHKGKVAVYSTDSEHKQENQDEWDAFVKMFKGADAVVFDAQYSLAEAVTLKEDWGHSSNIIGVELCHLAEAKRLVLFHHEPTCDDNDLYRIWQETIRYEELSRPDAATRLEVLSAYDGMELEL